MTRRKRGVRSLSRSLALTAAAAGLLLATACTATPAPESTASREVEAARAEAEQEEARQEAASRQEQRRQDERRRQESEPVREKLIVVNPGGKAAATSVAELSRASREERRRHGDRSVGELTDENLAELSKQGEVTYAGDGSVEEPGDGARGGEGEGDEGGVESVQGGDSLAATDPTDTPCGETCWRRRAYELRQAWNEATEEVAELEEEAANLRWRFYAEDDPWVRDSQVKPAWDRVLDRLRRKRDEAARYGERVSELMDRGRRAGALPGWLREGVELEPGRPDANRERSNPRQPTSVEPMEPTVVDEGSGEPDEQR